MNTPKALSEYAKAFANCSPGFEHCENPGDIIRLRRNPESLAMANPFRVHTDICLDSQGSRCAPTLGWN